MFCVSPNEGTSETNALGLNEQQGGRRATCWEMVTPESTTQSALAVSTVASWFDRHVDTIHRYVARRAGSDVARDVTADTFRIAIEQFERFDPRRGSERAWLYGIATNLLRRHQRAEQRRLRTELRSWAAEPSIVDPLLAADGRLDAHRELERTLLAAAELSPDDRDLLVLVAWERCSSAEAAQALGIPAGTVRSRLRRIRQQLGTDPGHTT